MKNLDKVIVNGIEKNIKYRRCSRCISDSTCPGIKFDKLGICNFCDLHDKWALIYPNGEGGKKHLEAFITTLKNSGKHKKYDCVVGISGGRDSTYLLYLLVKKYKLRPLAVHFNDGFDNPVAGENMLNTVKKLKIDLRTITSDYNISRDLKIAFLKASTPDLNQGTDVGIAASCYGVAHAENIEHIVYGQSFRTEGIKPLSWAYMEGEYLKSVHKKFGSKTLKPWHADKPGFNLTPYHLLYYSFVNGIKAHSPLYYEDYNRKRAEIIIKKEFNWVYPGAHYFDDLYWSLITYVHRVKFNIDFRLNSYSALIRDGQMQRNEALDLVKEKYVIEDEKVIDLCLRRLQVTRQDFDKWLGLSPKTFRNYKTGYTKMKLARPLIKLMCRSGFFPQIVYDKYFNTGS